MTSSLSGSSIPGQLESRLCLNFEGLANGKKYVLKVNPKNLKESKAFIENKKCSTSVSKVLSKLNNEEIFQLLMNSPNAIGVQYKKNCLFKRLNLTQVENQRVERKLYIKGATEGVKFRLLVFLDSLGNSRVDIKNSGKYVYLGPIQGNFCQLSNEQAIQALKTLNTTFSFAFNPDKTALILTSTLKPLLQSNPPTPVFAANQSPNFIANEAHEAEGQEDVALLTPPLNNARELVRHIKLKQERNENTDLLFRIAKNMVEQFRAIKIPFQREIQEITPLTEILSPDDCRVVLSSLLSGLNPHKLDDYPLLNALTAIFTQFQETNYAHGFEHARKEVREAKKLLKNPEGSGESWKAYVKEFEDQVNQYLKKANNLVLDNPLSSLTRAQLVDIAEKLSGKLTTFDQGDKELAETYLKAMIAVLNVMIFKGVDHLERLKHDQLCNAIRPFCENADFKIAFLARYGLQELALVENNENGLHSFLRRSWHIVKGLAIIAESISIIEPWQVLGSLDSLKEFRKAFRFQEGIKEWYLHLRILQFIFKRYPNAIEAFAKGFNDPKQSQALLNVENPFFMKGLVDIVSEVATNPMVTESVTRYSLDLLYNIWHDNSVEKNDKYKQDLGTYVLQLIYNLKEHPSDKIKRHVDQLLNQMTTLGAVLPKVYYSFQADFFPSDLFNNALDNIGVMEGCFRYIAQTLAKDRQMRKDRELFFAPEVQEKDFSDPEPFEDRMEAFIKGPDRILIVEGEPGFGKTIMAKVYAYQRAREMESQKPVILYFPLQKMKNPVTKLFHDGFKYNGIKDEKIIRDLENRLIVCFCDGYDEVQFEKGIKENLLISNRDDLDRYPLAKLIFLYRKNSADASCFESPPGLTSPQKVQLSPFQDEKINLYAWRYLKVKGDSSWSYEKYIKALEIMRKFVVPETRVKIISNRLLLAVTLEVLPFIMVKQRDAYLSANPTDGEPSFEQLLQGDFRKNIHTELLMAYTCVSAYREALRSHDNHIRSKQKEIPPVNAENIVQFQYDLAAKMQYDCQNLRQITFPLTNQAKSLESFLEIDVKTGFPSPRVQQLLDAGLMGGNEEGWMFRHEAFRQFFLAMDIFTHSPTQNRLEEIKSYLQNDRYHFRELVRR